MWWLKFAFKAKINKMNNIKFQEYIKLYHICVMRVIKVFLLAMDRKAAMQVCTVFRGIIQQLREN